MAAVRVACGMEIKLAGKALDEAGWPVKRPTHKEGCCKHQVQHGNPNKVHIDLKIG